MTTSANSWLDTTNESVDAFTGKEIGNNDDANESFLDILFPSQWTLMDRGVFHGGIPAAYSIKAETDSGWAPPCVWNMRLHSWWLASEWSGVSPQEDVTIGFGLDPTLGKVADPFLSRGLSLRSNRITLQSQHV